MLVIGCGNPLCGDDGAGPETVRRLRARGLPEGMECLDAGTDGIAAAFRMRGVGEVILVDACRGGGEPGSLTRLDVAELGNLPAVGAVNLHALRWDHALAFARWYLGADLPESVVVWLVEGVAFEPGGELSPEVDRGVDRLVQLLSDRFHGSDGDAAPP